MKKETLNISAPFFDGFYNTIHSPDNYDRYIIENIQEWYYKDKLEEKYPDIDFNDIDAETIFCDYIEFDYSSYKKDYSIKYIDFLKSEGYILDFEKIGIEKIDFKSVTSPRYYNYSNDSIYIDVLIDNDKLINYIKNNNDFINFIKKANNSYDGFVCFLSNDIDNYIEDFKNNNHKEAMVTQVLEFYISSQKEKNIFIEDFLNEYELYEAYYNNIKI